jgi:hypothetical protein
MNQLNLTNVKNAARTNFWGKQKSDSLRPEPASRLLPQLSKKHDTDLTAVLVEGQNPSHASPSKDTKQARTSE